MGRDCSILKSPLSGYHNVFSSLLLEDFHFFEQFFEKSMETLSCSGISGCIFAPLKKAARCLSSDGRAMD